MGYKRTGRPTGRPPSVTEEQWETALELLKDGCSYRETAHTLGIPKTTLRERYPGYGMTYSDGGQLYAINRKYSSTFFSIVYDPAKPA